jgi:chaperonin GroES
MSVLPLRDLVILRREKAEEVTPGGLIIPSIAQKKATIGVIVAVGKGRVLDNGKRIEPDVKVGQRAIFGEWVGQEVTLDDGEVGLMIKESDLYGIIEEA